MEPDVINVWDTHSEPNTSEDPTQPEPCRYVLPNHGRPFKPTKLTYVMLSERLTWQCLFWCLPDKCLETFNALRCIPKFETFQRLNGLYSWCPFSSALPYTDRPRHKQALTEISSLSRFMGD